MFRPVTARPDFVAQEHALLREWAERRTFARLRAQNAGNPRWSFLDGPITANNPMGVHHAWGRTYKDLFQRFHAMLGEDQRFQNGFDCQGLWVEVERRARPQLQEQAGHRGVRHRGVREPVQAAGAHLRGPPDGAVDPPRLLDGLERPGRAPAAAGPPPRRPDPAGHHRGPGRAGDRHGRDGRRPPRHGATSGAPTSRSATRTTTSSGASSPSATGAAGCTAATTRCRGARAAARACPRWR